MHLHRCNRCVTLIILISVVVIKEIMCERITSQSLIESSTISPSNNDITNNRQDNDNRPNFDGLNDMEIIRIGILPPGNTVALAWGKPIRELYDLNLTFGIYYGLNVDEALTDPKLSTKSLHATVEDLDFCSKYVFAVGVLNNKAPLQTPTNVRSIGTYIDRIAPPTNLQVEFLPLERPCLLIRWAASCPNIGDPLGYLVTTVEKGTSWTSTRWVRRSISADLTETVPVLYGKTYDIKIATDVTNANASRNISIKTPEYLQPFKVRVTSQNDTFIIFWREPYVPPYVGGFYYEVYVYPNADFDEQYEIHSVEKPVFLYKGNHTLYAFMVGLRSLNGAFGSRRLTDPIAKSLDGDAFALDVASDDEETR